MNKCNNAVKSILCIVFLCCFGANVIGQSCANGTYSYDDDILPILISKCNNCHGSNSVAGFNFSTYAGLLAGGNNCGSGVTPGAPSALASSIINKTQWVTGAPNATCGNNMPTAGTPLTPAEFMAIETWIADGAQESCPQISNCPPDFAFAGNGGLTGMENGIADYETNGILESTQTLNITAIVDYDSRMEVTLLPGFETLLGAQLEAFIDGCNGGLGGLN